MRNVTSAEHNAIFQNFPAQTAQKCTAIFKTQRSIYTDKYFMLTENMCIESNHRLPTRDCLQQIELS